LQADGQPSAVPGNAGVVTAGGQAGEEGDSGLGGPRTEGLRFGVPGFCSNVASLAVHVHPFLNRMLACLLRPATCLR
jgi:hypothetical protein